MLLSIPMGNSFGNSLPFNQQKMNIIKRINPSEVNQIGATRLLCHIGWDIFNNPSPKYGLSCGLNHE